MTEHGEIQRFRTVARLLESSLPCDVDISRVLGIENLQSHMDTDLLSWDTTISAARGSKPYNVKPLRPHAYPSIFGDGVQMRVWNSSIIGIGEERFWITQLSR